MPESGVVAPTIAAMRGRIGEARQQGHSIGFVPTMGALHEGHGELIRRARTEAGCAVVSIFVNAPQFNQPEDLEKYPRTFEQDVAYCQSLGVDLIFAPSHEEMYPGEMLTSVDVRNISDGLCGEFRPGHFRAIATVVAKLFNIVLPDRAYFGEKDAQQLAVIRKMTQDLNFPIEIVPVETVRESDGLAMSSRNARLTAENRRAAPTIHRALLAAAEAARGKDASPDLVKHAGLEVLKQEPAIQVVEYFEVVDAWNMEPMSVLLGEIRIVTAVWLGGIRLIDNVRVSVG